MSDDAQMPPNYRLRSAAELQTAIASVAFRVALLSQAIEKHLSPTNALLGQADKKTILNDVNRINADMMELAGDLLGLEKGE